MVPPQNKYAYSWQIWNLFHWRLFSNKKKKINVLGLFFIIVKQTGSIPVLVDTSSLEIFLGRNTFRVTLLTKVCSSYLGFPLTSTFHNHTIGPIVHRPRIFRFLFPGFIYLSSILWIRWRMSLWIRWIMSLLY